MLNLYCAILQKFKLLHFIYHNFVQTLIWLSLFIFVMACLQCLNFPYIMFLQLCICNLDYFCLHLVKPTIQTYCINLAILVDNYSIPSILLLSVWPTIFFKFLFPWWLIQCQEIVFIHHVIPLQRPDRSVRKSYTLTFFSIPITQVCGIIFKKCCISLSKVISFIYCLCCLFITKHDYVNIRWSFFLWFDTRPVVIIFCNIYLNFWEVFCFRTNQKASLVG